MDMIQSEIVKLGGGPLDIGLVLESNLLIQTSFSRQ